VELIVPFEFHTSSSVKEDPRILWNPKFSYRFTKDSQLSRRFIEYLKIGYGALFMGFIDSDTKYLHLKACILGFIC